MQQNIVLKLSCRNLPKSPEYNVSVDMFDRKRQAYLLLFHTETIRNNTNPQFEKGIVVNQSQHEKIRFRLFKKRGQMFWTQIIKLDEILLASDGCTSWPIYTSDDNIMKDSQNVSKITPTFMVCINERENVIVDIQGFFNSISKNSEIYFTILRKTTGKSEVIYDSELKNATNNVVKWQIFRLEKKILFNENASFVFRCFTKHKLIGDKPIGQFDFTGRDIHTTTVLNLQKDLTRKNSIKLEAKIHIQITNPVNVNIEVNKMKKESTRKKTKSHLDRYKGFMKFKPILALDFSSDDLKLNRNYQPYEKAISTACDTAEDLNIGDSFYLWGFGASNGNKVENCFSLTSDPNKTTVTRNEIIDYCRKCWNTVKCAPDKTISEIFHTVKQFILNDSMTQNIYYIVFFFLVGPREITELDKAKNLMIEMYHMPISIIFIAVDNNDLAALKYLNNLVRNSMGVENREYISFIQMDKKDEQISLSNELQIQIESQVIEYMGTANAQKLNQDQLPQSNIQLGAYNPAIPSTPSYGYYGHPNNEYVQQGQYPTYQQQPHGYYPNTSNVDTVSDQFARMNVGQFNPHLGESLQPSLQSFPQQTQSVEHAKNLKFSNHLIPQNFYSQYNQNVGGISHYPRLRDENDKTASFIGPINSSTNMTPTLNNRE